ncbi:hypothetical protein DsansV1_C17g0143811 [Dioscorea sansibarensis]
MTNLVIWFCNFWFCRGIYAKQNLQVLFVRQEEWWGVSVVDDSPSCLYDLILVLEFDHIHHLWCRRVAKFLLIIGHDLLKAVKLAGKHGFIADNGFQTNAHLISCLVMKLLYWQLLNAVMSPCGSSIMS